MIASNLVSDYLESHSTRFRNIQRCFTPKQGQAYLHVDVQSLGPLRLSEVAQRRQDRLQTLQLDLDFGLDLALGSHALREAVAAHLGDPRVKATGGQVAGQGDLSMSPVVCLEVTEIVWDNVIP